MHISDAAKILDLSGEITPAITKGAYRRAAMKYHPDRNPAGTEMMKMVGAAYDVLRDYTGNIPSEDSDQSSYPEAVNTALSAIYHLTGITIEICGAWVWVSGETYAHRIVLKEAGFHYAPKKKRWYFRPEDWKSKGKGKYSMDDIREKYGSAVPKMRKRKALQ